MPGFEGEPGRVRLRPDAGEEVFDDGAALLILHLALDCQGGLLDPPHRRLGCLDGDAVRQGELRANELGFDPRKKLELHKTSACEEADGDE